MNNLQSYTDFTNEKLSSSIYRVKKGENPLKKDKTPKWETKKDGDKYLLRDPKGGKWLEITKKEFDSYNEDRQKRFESVQEEEEEVWVPTEDKLGFYEPKKILKSLLKTSLGFNKGTSVPFFDSQRKCKEWCDEKDAEMYQNMDR